jgi:hypothetical protein
LDNLQEILNKFEPITLKEMDSVELMNRTDTKFMMSRAELDEILSGLSEHYRVLEINGIRQSRYETLYYDTEDFLFFRRHHSGKKNRYKIRKRSYVDSNLTYLEVKYKSNKDKTIKERTKLPGISEELEQQSKDFILAESHIEEELVPKIWNNFKRITLVNKSMPERLTIDCDLSFHNNDEQVDIPDLVIAEVKQERQNRHSPFMIELKKRRIRPDSISKYCLGVTMVIPGIKSNNFKQKILKIKKIQDGLAA